LDVALFFCAAFLTTLGADEFFAASDLFARLFLLAELSGDFLATLVSG